MDLAELLPKLLCIAWLLPLASFTLILFFGPRMGKHGILASYVATGAIAGAFLLSATSFCLWLGGHGAAAPGGHHEVHAEEDHHAGSAQSESVFRNASFAADVHDDHDAHATTPPAHYAGVW